MLVVGLPRESVAIMILASSGYKDVSTKESQAGRKGVYIAGEDLANQEEAVEETRWADSATLRIRLELF